MGQEVASATFTREDRQRYRQKMRRCQDALTQMLAESRFEVEGPTARPLTGLEVELNLCDDLAEPAMCNGEVLELIGNPDFVPELGQFNIEMNVRPRPLAGRAAAELEQDLRASLNAADARARAAGSRIVMIGILPTLTEKHLTGEVLSPNPRYALLNEQMLLARGEDIRIEISGVEQVLSYADSIAPEAACTSAQFHLQVAPDRFAPTWNAAQAVAGAQLALGANSPFLFGKELWRETRIALFEQATDTRPEELKSQGVRPRVWFGERWITSVFDLFEENTRYYSALLPIVDDEDPQETLERGEIPQLPELRLHNGTVYRWNRPVYDVVAGQPHLRVENRVLPSGPTVVDILANGAFYYGLVRALAEDERPVWSRMPFAVAEENFHRAARLGIDARLHWPGRGEMPSTDLVLRHLLPLAYEGLDGWGVDAGVRDRLLGIIEQRCLTRRNGATWQVETFHRLYDGGARSRSEALREMTVRYVDHMHSNEPVHTWPVGG